MKKRISSLKKSTINVIAILLFFSQYIVAQTSITTIESNYIQDFNALTTAGGWTNNSTLEGWYALNADLTTPTTFGLNDGTVTTTGLYSFGSTSDRAIGFSPIGGGSHTNEVMYVGWRLKNNTSQALKSIIVTWTGEQWRSEDNSEQYLNLYYQNSATAITEINTGLLDATSFTFTSPITYTITSLDGNNPSNRVTYTSEIAIDVPAGNEVLLVWETTDAANNHLLAIDDVNVSLKASQTITFPNLPNKTYGNASFNAGATTTATGLTISYSSDNTNVATISGSMITIVGPGTAYITATQAGNSNYAAATAVVRPLSVYPKVPVTVEATNISPTSFQANWTADNGLNGGTTTYNIQYATNISFTGSTTITGLTSKTRSFTGLTPNTIYYYNVRASNSGKASSYNIASAITTGSDYRSNGNGDWTNANNWIINTGGDVWVVSPTNSVANSIEILHNCLINSGGPITTNKLFIKNDAKLSSNQQINVLNELIIEVGPDGTAGQILNLGNIILGGNTKVIVRKSFSTPLKWHFIGFPFDVTSDNIFSGGTNTPLTWGDLNSGANFVVQQYNGNLRASAGTAEVVNQGLHWGNVSPKIFTAKKGYIVYKSTPGTIDFVSRGVSIGSFFSTSGASVSTGRYTASQQIHSDWNLVSSPLSSIYNLGSTSPGTSYYRYNNVNYTSVLAGEVLDIQPFSAFFLQAPATSISFANAGRKVSSLSVQTASVVDDICLNLSNGNNLYDDQTRIRLQEDASADYVIGTDAAKMFGMDSNVSYIYSTINGFYTAINTLPATTSNVELQTKFAANGNYTISILNTVKISNYAAVILYDKVTGQNTDLLSVGTYSFTSSAGTSNRFTIKLSPKITTGVSKSELSDIVISSFEKNARISGLSATANVTVYDMTGKATFKGLVENDQTIKLESKGLYIFEVSLSDRVEKLKVYVK